MDGADCSAATTPWARTVFPDLPEAEAVSRLWDAIFAASRVDGPDPVAAWEAHNAALHARMLAMNPERQPTSRLSCQMTATEQWDGLIVELPEYQL